MNGEDKRLPVPFAADGCCSERRRSFRRHRARAQGAAKPLQVGGLPVTCNLTLPVACAASRRRPAQPSGAPLFEFSKYSGWPEIKESLMSGRLRPPTCWRRSSWISPTARYRSRSCPSVIARARSSWSGPILRTRRFKDLTGKRVAIPSRFAVDYLFLRKMLAKEGMTVKDLDVIEMAPPDMPAALYAKAVDALRDRRALRRGRAARRLRAASLHDARRVAELHLLRPDRAR